MEESEEKMDLEKVDETFESEDLFYDEEEVESDKSYRGAEFGELRKNVEIKQNYKETVCLVQHRDWSLPHPREARDIWTHNFVRLPWSRHNEFPKNGSIVKRFDEIPAL